MKEIVLVIVIFSAFLSGCGPSKPSISDTVQLAAIASEPTTVTPTLTKTTTEEPTPTNTITPIVTPGFCNDEAAKKAIAVIDELIAKNETSSPTNTPTPGQSAGLTDEQRKKVIAAFEEHIEILDKLTVPDCLKLSVEYLRTSYNDFIKLFDDVKDENVFDLLAKISEDQRLFEEEYSRVKGCVESGCK